MFSYEPKPDNSLEKIKYRFQNSSGNIINNPKKSKLFSVSTDEDEEIEDSSETTGEEIGDLGETKTEVKVKVEVIEEIA